MGSAYRTAQETLRATELTQYITSLEFGIRYGKNLENYFNMDEVLQSILRTSPYVEGAYILSNENALLYSAGEALPNPAEIRVLHNGGELYASSEQFGYALMFMDIEDAEGGRAGTLVILLNDDIMTRLIESYQGEGRVQSWVILGEVLLLFLLVHTRLTRAGRRRLSALALAVLLSVTVLFAQGLDIGIETAKLRVELETITSQSVQKIAQVLQQQVEGVMDKGVGVDDLYDIYGWLDDINEKLDMVQRLDFTEEGKVRATMDSEYLAGRTLCGPGRDGLAIPDPGRRLRGRLRADGAGTQAVARARRAHPARGGAPCGGGLSPWPSWWTSPMPARRSC